MPGNKRRRRKPKKPKAAKPADQNQDDAGGGGITGRKGAKSFANSYGAPKTSRSPISPAMNRGTARGR